MIVPAADSRSPDRRARDETIAFEPPLDPLDLPADETPSSLEFHQRLERHPFAVAGIVEGGLVRPLDPAVKLPENSRVIIVASKGT